jgi:hypothetical protein
MPTKTKNKPVIQIDAEGWLAIASTPINLFETFGILAPRPDCEDAHQYAERCEGSLITDDQARLIFHEVAQRWHLKRANEHGEMEHCCSQRLHAEIG